MAFADLFTNHWLGVPYHPHPDVESLAQRAHVQKAGEVEVHITVLDGRESEDYFGVPLAHRGIQPVWLQIRNLETVPYRLSLASIDRNYYPPLEAAYINHFRIAKRLLGYGLLAWLLFPLLIFLLPFKVFGAWIANRRMNAFFVAQGIGWGLIRPGTTVTGFVFTTLDEGTKQVTVKLLGTAGTKDFFFALPIPGLKVDYHGKQLAQMGDASETLACDEQELRQRLTAMARWTTNRRGVVAGDPLNLVVIGEFATILSGFGARWDETETITLRSCLRTAKAFIRGQRYRYSPVSPLYVEGRSQDFALQKTRQTINQRLHLRLWLTPLRFQGKPVWIGQVSRDIGVRFTWKTWNLTTHKIDPDVDDARDYVLDDLMERGRVAAVGYVAGVGAADPSAPRHNLTGDPYFTDGLRAVAVFTETQTTPTFLNWA